MDDEQLLNKINNLTNLRNSISYKKDALAMLCLIVSWLISFAINQDNMSILNVLLALVSISLVVLSMYYIGSNTIDMINILNQWKTIERKE